jgi:hypothetical protein
VRLPLGLVALWVPYSGMSLCVRTDSIKVRATNNTKLEELLRILLLTLKLRYPIICGVEPLPFATDGLGLSTIIITD